MARSTVVALYVVVMVTAIVVTDVLLFRNRTWAQLMWNIGTVLMFGAIYLRFLPEVSSEAPVVLRWGANGRTVFCRQPRST